MDADSNGRAEARGQLPLVLSATSVNDYMSCRLRYALTYLSLISPRERLPVSLLALGEAIHKVIADPFRLGGWSRVAREDLAVLLGAHWPDGIYKDPAIDAANFDHALELLGRFFDNPFPDQVVQELDIERRHTWRRFRRGILATGRIDRACQLADGTVMLIDYKSGARPRAAEWLRMDPQALIYRSLGSEAYGHLAPTRLIVAFFYLGIGAAVSIEFDAEEFQAGWQRIERVAEAIRQGMAAVIAGDDMVNAFPPSRGEHCCRCPMRRHCDGLARAGAFDHLDAGIEGGAA